MINTVPPDGILTDIVKVVFTSFVELGVIELGVNWHTLKDVIFFYSWEFGPDGQIDFWGTL